MGGPPNPGTAPDKRLKDNSDKSKVKNKAEDLKAANKNYAKSIPVDGPRKLPPAKDVPGQNQLPPSFVKNIRKK